LKRSIPLALCTALAALGCYRDALREDPERLVGAWRSTVHFDNGPFASLPDLEFLYVFNSGGTLIESSNYDSAPPVAPAYGAWIRVGPSEFLATYEFFVTKAPARIEDLSTGGGWLPDGRGRFNERIRIAADGSTFDSSFSYSPLKADGSPAGESVSGRAHAVRIVAQRQ
jgi:hypothetical protein